MSGYLVVIGGHGTNVQDVMLGGKRCLNSIKEKVPVNRDFDIFCFKKIYFFLAPFFAADFFLGADFLADFLAAFFFVAIFLNLTVSK